MQGGIGAGSHMASRWVENWQPFHDVLARLNLPPRKKRGSKGNVERTRIVNAAMHQESVRRMDSDKRAKHDTRCPLCRIDLRKYLKKA
jgi:hypothetical protein